MWCKKEKKNEKVRGTERKSRGNAIKLVLSRLKYVAAFAAGADGGRSKESPRRKAAAVQDETKRNKLKKTDGRRWGRRRRLGKAITGHQTERPGSRTKQSMTRSRRLLCIHTCPRERRHIQMRRRAKPESGQFRSKKKKEKKKLSQKGAEKVKTVAGAPSSRKRR